MAPYPALNASSAELSLLHQPQPSALQPGGFNRNQWGPDAIGTVLFGVIMFLVGVTALWQGRLRSLRLEEGTWNFTPSFIDKPADTHWAKNKAGMTPPEAEQLFREMKLLVGKSEAKGWLWGRKGSMAWSRSP